MRQSREVRTGDRRLSAVSFHLSVSNGNHITRRIPPRVVIADVQPQVEDGRFPIKRVEGEPVDVTANIFADGHDQLGSMLLHRRCGEAEWRREPMRELGNDLWAASFLAGAPGNYEYTIEAWIDHFRTWRTDLVKRVSAGQDVSTDLEIGANLVRQAAERAEENGNTSAAAGLRDFALRLTPQNAATTFSTGPLPVDLALDENLFALVSRHPDPRLCTSYEKPLRLTVDRQRARFSAWYELFPRSWGLTPGKHGTFKECESRLGYIAEMGFDVLYLPPIHPIGLTNRKGKNNAVLARPGDVGSPWAIGAGSGGHKWAHPELGTLEDFEHFVAKSREYGLEVALDIAYQCSPDHPYVREHPEWFRHRPDGSVQYAENPPKKYEDIYPFNFETESWEPLWEELKSVVLFWIGKGVRIFRVDNPHTKPFAFWEWLIEDVKSKHPETIFLAEAFTRPAVMRRLAALGFTQSYTYFAWRNTKWELTSYLTELTQTGMREYFRPNFWPNTPDILTAYLQDGGRPAFIARLVLAATLGASYGIYGAAFELCENVAIEHGKEEYLNAEKYEIRAWDLANPASLRPLITRINHARHENPALQSNDRLKFHGVDNDQLIAYSKTTEDHSNAVLAVVNLDPFHAQAGWLDLSLPELGLDPNLPFSVRDLLTDAVYRWQGPRNFVRLDPGGVPAHVLRIERGI